MGACSGAGRKRERVQAMDKSSGAEPEDRVMRERVVTELQAQFLDRPQTRAVCGKQELEYPRLQQIVAVARAHRLFVHGSVVLLCRAPGGCRRAGATCGLFATISRGGDGTIRLRQAAFARDRTRRTWPRARSRRIVSRLRRGVRLRSVGCRPRSAAHQPQASRHRLPATSRGGVRGWLLLAWMCDPRHPAEDERDPVARRDQAEPCARRRHRFEAARRELASGPSLETQTSVGRSGSCGRGAADTRPRPFAAL